MHDTSAVPAPAPHAEVIEHLGGSPILVSEDPPLYERELSWVAFNERVLQEAEDPRVPLGERVNFLAIFSSNLDEFFRVRVAGLRALLRLKKKKRKELDFDVAALVDEIHARVGAQQERFGAVFRDEILPGLAAHGLHLRDARDLPEAQFDWLDEFFRDEVAPHLQPVILGDVHVGNLDVPFLDNGRLYLAVELWPAGVELRGDEPTVALVEVPAPPLARFIELPAEVSPEGERTVLFLDDVVRHGLPTLFPEHEVERAYGIKLTRDADLQVEDEFSGDLVDKIRKGVERRSKGVPSRFLYDGRMPHGVLVRLQEALELEDEDLVLGGRYHHLSDLWTLPRPDDDALAFPPFPPLPHPGLAEATSDGASVLDAMAEREWLLHFPYQQYDPVVQFFADAAADPDVEAVWATLYRVARDSAIVQALIAAAEAGKRVEVFVEVKARFDEENNLTWAGRMEEAGVRVHYSMPGLKVHAKLGLAARREGEAVRHYAYFGTGNFNERTSLVYGDHALLTADPRLADESRRVFAFLTGADRDPSFEHLLVAPFTMRDGVYDLIDREIEYAQAGRGGAIFAKMNALEDEGVITKLYEAAQAGVEVRLLIRGILRLVPGIEGLSEGIEVRSIVDRFLEHARVWHFANDGDEVLYLASADWMKRNLSERVEVAFPIYDDAFRAELKAILELQWSDDTKARVLDAAQSNAYRRPDAPTGVRAQFDTYRRLAKQVETAR